MISVVIPLYNKESHIAETIHSALSQTFKNFELIIVNDGSTDHSADVVKAMTDPRIKLITIENSGVSVARNTGIEAAKNKWVALLDADDWWATTFLEKMVNAMEAHPQHKIFVSGRSRVFQKTVERYQHQLLPPDQQTAAVNYFEIISKHLPPIHSSSVMVDKSIFETTGYFKEGQKKHEDHDLWMRLAVGHEVVMVNKNLSFYRKTEENTASRASFSATDFCDFLSTMIGVKEKLTLAEQGFFKKYYNRYALLVYFQYYGRYSKKEHELVFEKISTLLNGTALMLARTIKILPLKGCYRWLKKIKG